MNFQDFSRQFTEISGEAFDEEKETNPWVRYRKEIFSFLLGRPLMIVHHIAMAFVFIPMILVRRDHEPGKAFRMGN